MNIDSIIDHQAWIDKEILPSRTKPSLDNLRPLQGVWLLVKSSLFLTRSLSQGPQLGVKWMIGFSCYHFLVFTGHCILLLIPYYHIKFSTYPTRIRGTFYNLFSDFYHILPILLNEYGSQFRLGL